MFDLSSWQNWYCLITGVGVLAQNFQAQSTNFGQGFGRGFGKACSVYFFEVKSHCHAVTHVSKSQQLIVQDGRLRAEAGASCLDSVFSVHGNVKHHFRQRLWYSSNQFLTGLSWRFMYFSYLN